MEREAFTLDDARAGNQDQRPVTANLYISDLNLFDQFLSRLFREPGMDSVRFGKRRSDEGLEERMRIQRL
jgi:hypothetical protein